ncbi:hypothetical protein RCL1_002662 [Eukaryota sp. TZLM3-RCL]
MLLRDFKRLISISTLHRILIASGLSLKKCSQVMKIANLELVQAFCLSWNERFGIVRQDQLVFLDEISFRSDDFHRPRGRSPKGEAVATLKVQFSEKQVSCAVSIDCKGIILSHIKEGHYDRSAFVQFLSDLIDSGHLFRYPGPRSILILDGCKIHFSPDVYEAMRKAGLMYVKLPPYCPEMNPIEAFFAVLRRRVRLVWEHNQQVNPVEILNSQLSHLQDYDCSRLFDHSGFCDYKYYSSPYMSEDLPRIC